MPAKSKSQQRLFGMALAVRRGDMKRSDVWKEVLDIVDSDMTNKEIEDFASTKHNKIKECKYMKNICEYIKESSGRKPGDEAIEIREEGKYGYMYYDPNTGLVSTYCMNSWKNLVDDFGEDEDWARDLEKLRVGQSLDHDSGSIYTRIW